jgi:hypothetical protein
MYCISSTSASNIAGITKAQKKAIRIIIKCNYTAHSTTVSLSLHRPKRDTYSPCQTKIQALSLIQIVHHHLEMYGSLIPTSEIITISLGTKTCTSTTFHTIESNCSKSPLYQLPLCWKELDDTIYYQNMTTTSIARKGKAY